MPAEVVTSDLLDLAIKTVNEDPKRRSKDIDHIKQWLKKQPHLNARTDEEWLLIFLRGCKFSLEKTKQKLETYYTFRTLLPEFFGNRDPLRSELKALYNIGAMVPLPKPDHEGRNVYLVRTAITDPKKFKPGDMLHVNFMSMDVQMMVKPRSIIAGDVIILDYAGCTLDHILVFTPAITKKVLKCYQEAFPIRPQAIHFINTGSAIEKIFMLTKPFMTKKLQERMHVHGSLESLYKSVPRDLLPSDYGGKLSSADHYAAEWQKIMESHRDWFLEDAKHKSDEKKRVGAPRTTSDVFGIEGSFRSLDLD